MSKESVFDYNLGKLSYFDSKNLFNDPDRVEDDEVFLALALAYNDLKGLLLFHDALDENRAPVPQSGLVCAKSGQFSGLKWQALRFITGVVNEIVRLCEEKNKIINAGTFVRANEKLKEQGKNAWSEFLKFIDDVGSNEKDMVDLRRLLGRIRGDATFHYQGGGELVTKGVDGKIRSKDTIAPGHDPNPPRDKEH